MYLIHLIYCLCRIYFFCVQLGHDNYAIDTDCPCCTPMTEPGHAGPKDRPTMPYSTPAGEEDLEYVSDELPDPKSLCLKDHQGGANHL